MNCTNLNGYGQECGDEGITCDICTDKREQEFAYLRKMPRYAVFDDEEAREELNQELREAGRSHLCR